MSLNKDKESLDYVIAFYKGALYGTLKGIENSENEVKKIKALLAKHRGILVEKKKEVILIENKICLLKIKREGGK